MKYKYLFLLVVLILTSCASPVTPAPTQTITPAPTATQTLTPTVVPTNTPTITPTKAPEVISPSNASRLERFVILGHGKAEHAAVSPDNKIIAVASTLGIILYNAETLEKMKIIEPDQTPYSLSFSPDGTKLAIGLSHVEYVPYGIGVIGNNVRSVEVWDIQASTMLYHFDDYSNFWDMSDLVFSPDGCQLIDGGKIIHNICDNTTSKKSANDWRDTSAVFSPDGKYALVNVNQGGWSSGIFNKIKKIVT